MFMAPSLLSYRTDIKYNFIVLEIDEWGWKRELEVSLAIQNEAHGLLVFDLEFRILLIFISCKSQCPKTKY